MNRIHRILVVDDDPELCELITVVLTDAGYAVATAANGAAALARVPDFAPCVILLDLYMPVMDGWNFARAYQRLDQASASIVVMTAASEATKLEMIAPAGILYKPFALDELQFAVRSWVQEHQLE